MIYNIICDNCGKYILQIEANSLKEAEEKSENIHCCGKNIPIYKVLCICNTEIEVEENSVAECPNCHKEIDDKGVIQ